MLPLGAPSVIKGSAGWVWKIPKGQIFTLIEVGKHDLFTSKGIKRCGQYGGHVDEFAVEKTNKALSKCTALVLNSANTVKYMRIFCLDTVMRNN